MRQWSLKIKLTAWYTAITAVIAVLAVVALSKGMSRLQLGSMKQSLVRAVSLAAEEVDYEDGAVELEGNGEDILEAYEEITFAMFDLEGKPLYGALPGLHAPFIEGEARTVQSDLGSPQLVYDRLIAFKKHPAVWLRGALSLGTLEESVGKLHAVALFMLPVLVLLAALGGYGLARRALRPVEEMVGAARTIAGGEDLERRIPVPPAQDEIARLAEAFNEMLARLNQAFYKERQLVSDAAHELRTPLAVMMAQSEYALAQETTRQDQQEAVRVIHETGERMARQISQLLQLARMDMDKEPFQMETLNLTDLLEGIVQEMAEVARAKGMELKAELTPNITLQGDQLLLMSLYLNLLTNAIAYGKQGGHMFLRLWEEEGHILSSVEDDGMGIAPEHLPRIWDRYYRVDSARGSGEGHAGLGLSIVQWIVRRHGGQIQVKSLQGEGTVFTVRFSAPIK